MLRKDVPVKQTPEALVLFKCLKKALTKAPVLALPRDDCPYTLDRDASNFGCGAVLSQFQDGKLHIISFHHQFCVMYV